MGGSELFGLRDEGRLVVDLAHHVGDRFAAMPGDHHHPPGLRRARRAQRMGDEGRSGEHMQDLGKLGIHPRALSGGEHDGCKRHVTELRLIFRFVTACPGGKKPMSGSGRPEDV